MKSQVAKKQSGLHFRVKEQMHVPPLILHADQVGDDLVEKPFSLMRVAYGKAAERIPEAAPRTDDVVILVVHRAGIIEVRVAANPFLLEKAVDLRESVFVTGVHF